MTSVRPKRSVTELPGDPARLHLHYGHGHSAVPYDYEDTLESWYVQVTYGWPATRSGTTKRTGTATLLLRAPRSGTSSCGGCATTPVTTGGRQRTPNPAISRSSSPLSLAGPDATATALRSRKRSRIPSGPAAPRPRQPPQGLEGLRAGPRPGRRSDPPPVRGLLRGRGLSGHGEYPEDHEQVTEAYRRQAKTKIAALWESIGFQPFREACGSWIPPCASPRSSYWLAVPTCTRSAPPSSGPTRLRAAPDTA
ncbi:hypothetical protein SHL15_9279 [Streptomyces hygroscopicus subsp. limoneus]|nr:hypothetical protein SHL15_9279 [Streptomyces hygroscopicus subsp. limoneus]